MIKVVCYLSERWEFEKSFFDRAVIINMDGIFVHVVNKVGIWFDKVIENAEHLHVFSFFLEESVECHIIRI